MLFRSALNAVRGALDEKKRIDRAKLLLISHYGLTEQAAHERLQRAAMDAGLALADVARQVIGQLGGQSGGQSGGQLGGN